MRPLESGALAADSQAVEFGGAFGRTAASRQKAECRVKCVLLIGFKRVGCSWSKSGANALLAIRCCLENMRWPDFLEWRACRAAAA